MKLNVTRVFFSILCCLLVAFLAACGSNLASPGNASSGQKPLVNPGHGTSVPGSMNTPGGTQPMPPTQTSCPAAGTARAAVMRPLALGSNANIIYIVNEASGNAPVAGTLKRYDIVTGNKTEIVKLPHASISEAQLSADGQWIIFVSIVSDQARLQLVRMDGQGLQTLYCAGGASNGASPGSAISGVQWASDQNLIAFDNYATAGGSLYILSARNGSLQRDLFRSGSGPTYPTRTWLDTTRLFIGSPMVDAPSGTLYLLDTSRGGNQTPSDLQQVYDASASQFCWDFDSSYNGTQLFTSTCQASASSSPGPGEPNKNPPSVVGVRAISGGNTQFILKSSTLAVVGIRAVSSTTLLLETASTSTATANNGLWKMQTNGSGLKQLISYGAGVSASGLSGTLNRYNQYPWSNVSRNGSLYAFEEDSSTNNTTTLLYGSLNGGSTTTFASIGAGTVLSIVGWTTM